MDEPSRNPDREVNDEARKLKRMNSKTNAESS